MLKRKIILAFLINMAATSLVDCQISEIQKARIDSLVTSWDVPNSPGGAVGIMCNGNL